MFGFWLLVLLVVYWGVALVVVLLVVVCLVGLSVELVWVCVDGFDCCFLVWFLFVVWFVGC